MKKLALFTSTLAFICFTSCEDDSILGCNDSNAINYNSAATENDSSCLYEENPDLIIGSWQIENFQYEVQINQNERQNLVNQLSNLNLDDFLESFPNQTMPSTDIGWMDFVNDLAQGNPNLIGSNSNMIITEENITINMLNNSDTHSYEYTNENRIILEHTTGLFKLFEISNLDEQNLVLKVSYYLIDPILDGFLINKLYICSR